MEQSRDEDAANDAISPQCLYDVQSQAEAFNLDPPLQWAEYGMLFLDTIIIIFALNYTGCDAVSQQNLKNNNINVRRQ